MERLVIHAGTKQFIPVRFAVKKTADNVAADIAGAGSGKPFAFLHDRFGRLECRRTLRCTVRTDIGTLRVAGGDAFVDAAGAGICCVCCRRIRGTWPVA